METSKAPYIIVIIAALLPLALNQDLKTATKDMQKANYFTFVTLLNMAPRGKIHVSNVTFFMPDDRALSRANMTDSSAVDFLLRHSVPSPLPAGQLRQFPSGSFIPTSLPGFMVKVSTDGRGRVLLNNVKIARPDVCKDGSSVRCHGIDGVLHPSLVPQLNGACPVNSTDSLASPRQVLGILAAPPSPVDGASPTKSCSPRAHAQFSYYVMAVVGAFVMLLAQVLNLYGR